MMFQIRSPQVAALTRVSLRSTRQPCSRGSISKASTLAHQRACLSKTWLPTGGLAPNEKEDGHSKLVRAGYLRQSHAGVFHMLPLGQRVQEKLEKLIDKHMLSVGASKVSLSSLSSEALWEKTKRLEAYGPELFRLTDRKDAPLLLAPTHEEEITNLVAKLVTSYRSLPLRLYQIGRKYRDELRPRQGVLRSREFLMKDLYTFDASVDAALQSYEEVRAAYSRLFDELKIPYVVAEASSGDIGGDLSHEYHLPSSMGEDMVISCNSCTYVANEELATAKSPSQEQSADKARVWRGVTKDRSTLVNVWFPNMPGLSGSDINTHAIKSVVPQLDSSMEDSIAFWTQDSTPESESPKVLKLVNVVDRRMSPDIHESIKGGKHPQLFPTGSNLKISSIKNETITKAEDGQKINALRIRDGDNCAHCESGELKVQKAVELGHTFHLGTRYSEPLGAKVQLRENTMAPMQMGCHGIGVSRIIGAVANHLADERGLNWPRVIAPYEVVIIAGRGVEDEDANQVYDQLVGDQQQVDAVLDDRPESFPWKMKDADTVGHPVIVLLGRKWLSDKMCEVQCRRLKVKEDVAFDELPVYINNLLSQL
ncbi:prolyl-tRNA synthetase [Apiospora arundinis]|uniref:proline--tRNA ligase n=1 Tax=Apiospora arundinis TaxID=335852 RepID=A0ABR2J733_9PEZI